MLEFEKWRSIPRLSKERMTITEKIDGSNAAVIIIPIEGAGTIKPVAQVLQLSEDNSWNDYCVYAQSRTRFIYPEDDNFGFANWVNNYAKLLVEVLGPGKHYGEWWGSKIQSGYGLKNERRFSLFNTGRWTDTIHTLPGSTAVSELCTVPVLYTGPFSAEQIILCKELMRLGSKAVEHKWDAEGIVVDLREAGARYKILLKNDDIHKWEQKNG